MSIAEEISKLADLRDKGVLSAEEFEQAKHKVLSENQDQQKPRKPSRNRYEFEDGSRDSFGKAANRYVTYKMIMAGISVLLFLVFFAPKMCRSSSPFNNHSSPNFNSSFPR